MGYGLSDVQNQNMEPRLALDHLNTRRVGQNITRSRANPDKMAKMDKQLEIVSDILKNPKATVMFFVGAGISATSDGKPLIPDFRSPGTGLFYNLKKLNLPTPESVFDIDFFEDNPAPFYALCKDLHPEMTKFNPTRFHYFMKMIDEKNELRRIYTQNIDCLERLTGIDSEKIIEAHGSFAEDFCIKCSKKNDKQHFLKQLLDNKIPKCEHCKDGVLKPGIVFYGEQLPDVYHEKSEVDFKDNLELCIFAGTSLNVYPFASLAEAVPKNCVRVLINKEKVGDFKINPRKSDVLVIGDCDQIADKLADLCGWQKELDALVKSHENDTEQAKTAAEMVDDMKHKDLKVADVADDLAAELSELSIKKDQESEEEKPPKAKN